MAVCGEGGGTPVRVSPYLYVRLRGCVAFLIFNMCSPSVYTVVGEFLTLHSIYLYSDLVVILEPPSRRGAHPETAISTFANTLSRRTKKVRLLRPLAKFLLITIYNSERRVCIISVSGHNMNVSIVCGSQGDTLRFRSHNNELCLSQNGFKLPLTVLSRMESGLKS